MIDGGHARDLAGAGVSADIGGGIEGRLQGHADQIKELGTRRHGASLQLGLCIETSFFG